MACEEGFGDSGVGSSGSGGTDEASDLRGGGMRKKEGKDMRA